MSPRILALGWIAAAALTACGSPALRAASPTALTVAADVPARLADLPPADALLLGEQHDVPAHRTLQLAAVQHLASTRRLAALLLEMADAGRGTAGLGLHASEAQARAALDWRDDAWPWADYGPVVMAAVGAGVPVLGANLPRDRMKEATESIALDNHLTPTSWQKLLKNLREGHCGLLPERQIVPMARVQVARDAAMAAALRAAAQPGRTVLLIAGNEHVRRSGGVPSHLPPQVSSVSVVFGVAPGSGTLAAGGIDRSEGSETADADAVWRTSAPPAADPCESLRRARRPSVTP